MSDYITIPLTSRTHPGMVAIIEACEAYRVNRFRWHLRPSYDRFYADTGVKVDGKWLHIHLHRYIMGAPEGVLVDHKNGDGLDCRYENMRYASHLQNSVNSRLRRDSASPFKGIHLRKDTGRWQVKIKAMDRQIHLGFFSDAESAARAYDAAARMYFGEFAKLNFPEETTA